MPETDEGSALPQGVEFSPVDEDFGRDPYTAFKTLSERAPVHHDRVMNRYLCTRQDDVEAILHDKDLFTDPRNASPGSCSREVIRCIVEGALDAITEGEFDLISRFAAPVPTVVIARLRGVDPAVCEESHTGSGPVVRVGFNPFPTEGQKHAAAAAQQALNELFRDEIARRGDARGDDLLSDIMRAELEGDRLTQEEMNAQCRLLLIAGNVTTTDLIGNGTRAAGRPGADGNAACRPGRVRNRESGHASPGLRLGRHPCLGAHLAGVEAQEAIPGLLRRFPRLCRSERGHVFHAMPSFRGMREFWVRGD